MDKNPVMPAETLCNTQKPVVALYKYAGMNLCTASAHHQHFIATQHQCRINTNVHTDTLSSSQWSGTLCGSGQEPSRGYLEFVHCFGCSHLRIRLRELLRKAHFLGAKVRTTLLHLKAETAFLHLHFGMRFVGVRIMAGLELWTGQGLT